MSDYTPGSFMNGVTEDQKELENEIITLKKRLQELENKKRDEIKYNEKRDVNKNLAIINTGIEERKDKVKNNHYSKSCIVAKFIDNDMVPQLEAIYNLLETFDERLEKLECKY